MQVAEKTKLLLKYVKEVQPALIEQFVDQGPPAVVAAMRNTITNMVRAFVLPTLHQLLTAQQCLTVSIADSCFVHLVLVQHYQSMQSRLASNRLGSLCCVLQRNLLCSLCWTQASLLCRMAPLTTMLTRALLLCFTLSLPAAGDAATAVLHCHHQHSRREHESAHAERAHDRLHVQECTVQVRTRRCRSSSSR
jgi:hypothetical protein